MKLYYVTAAAAIALWIFPPKMVAEETSLKLLLADPKGRSSIIETTTDENRDSRVTDITGFLTAALATQSDPREMVRGALIVLADIANTSSPLSIIQSYVDHPILDSDIRSAALVSLGQITHRISGPQAVNQLMQPYLHQHDALISRQARLQVASTNTEAAAALLQSLLDSHIAALPAQGFVVTEQNGDEIEARFGAVIMDVEAMNSMELPEVKAKAQQTLTSLRDKYPSGPALEAISELEAVLATPQ